MNKINNTTITKLFNFTRQTWTKWQEEGRLITKLLKKYFTTEDLEEFLTTNQIKKLELIKNLSLEELEKKLSSTINNPKITLNNKLIAFPLKAIAALYFILKNNQFIATKKNFLNVAEKEFNAIFKIEVNLSLDFSTKWDKNTLIKYVDYLLSDEDINLLFQDKDYYLSYINFIKKSKRWF